MLLSCDEELSQPIVLNHLSNKQCLDSAHLVILPCCSICTISTQLMVQMPLESYKHCLYAAAPIRRFHLPSREWSFKSSICQTSALRLSYHSSERATEAGQQALPKSVVFQWPSQLSRYVHHTLTGCCSCSFQEDTYTINTACQTNLKNSLVQANWGIERRGVKFLTAWEDGW